MGCSKFFLIAFSSCIDQSHAAPSRSREQHRPSLATLAGSTRLSPPIDHARIPSHHAPMDIYALR
jgi:hypothetical protein